MGWWGVGVVNGDGPRDIIDTIEFLCDMVDEEDYEQAKDSFINNRNSFKAVSHEAKLNAGLELGDEETVTYQTLAFLYLKWQVTMPAEFKQQVLEKTKAEINDLVITNSEGWKDPDERKAALEKFTDCVEKDNGGGLEFGMLFWSAELNDREFFD